MAVTAPTELHTVETPAGEVEYADAGAGDPVVFVHGSPGGADQGALMGRFLVDAGFRVVAPSRPGYLGTQLTDGNGTPAAQSELVLALVDALGLGSFRLACWSGGGPSSFHLAATHPDRVLALTSFAGVSGPYEFAGGVAGMEESLLQSRFGRWMMKELVRHEPKQVVGMIPAEEGDLTKEQAKELAARIWDDETQREFVLALSETVAGRSHGFRNDKREFPSIGDLGLASIACPTLLVHGTADSDVPPEHSDRALAAIPGAAIHRIPDGTHVAAWADPSSAEVQAAVVDFLRAV